MIAIFQSISIYRPARLFLRIFALLGFTAIVILIGKCAISATVSLI
jgi:hypothetical protein